MDKAIKVNMGKKMIINRYSIERKIGQGGMGIVYLVKDSLKDNMIFALKTIRENILKETGGISIKSFKNEYEIMTRLKHPNLTRVYDFGMFEDNYYIIMEYVTGKPLSSYINHQDRLHTEYILNMIVKILRTLEFIHSRNILYRDLKPSNIMLNKEGNIKLLDFGLSAFMREDSDNIRGTLFYLSPETLQGKLDYKADIYSLGLVFYELLANEHYILREKADMRSILDLLGDPDQFRVHKKHQLEKIADPHIRDILDKMISFYDSERYDNCSEIIRDISNISRISFDYETNETSESYVLGSTFINRKKELGLLKSRIYSKKTGGIFLYKGPVGIGKTRLFEEFRKYCRLNDILFFEANCMEGEIRQYNGIADILDQMVIYSSEKLIRKYAEYLKIIIPRAERLKSHNALNYKGDPASYKALIISKTSDYIIDFSKESELPIIIYFNDIQFLDYDSIEIIIKLSEQKSVLIYANMDECHDMSFLNKNWVKIEELKPFGNKSTKEYIECVFGKNFLDKSIPQSIKKIRDRVGGNPLFLQEILRSLIKKKFIIKDIKYWKLLMPIDDIEIPKNLTGILQQRIKGIMRDKNMKKLLQSFSLMRIDISRNILGAIIKDISDIDLGNVLLELERLEIVQSYRVKEEEIYSFSSNLIKELIRKGIRNKKNLHLLIAEALESMSGFNEEIVYHYYRGKNIEKTLLHSKICAENAERDYFIEKAIKHYDMIIKLHKNDNCDEKLSYIGKKAIAMNTLGMGKDAILLLRKCGRISESIGNKSIMIKANNASAQILIRMGEKRQAFPVLKKSLRIAEKMDNKSLLVDTLINMGLYYSNINDNDKAIAIYNKCIDHLDGLMPDKKNYYYSAAINNLGNIYFKKKEYQLSKQYYNECLKMSEDMKDKAGYAMSLGNLGNIYFYQGLYDKSLKYYETYRKISIEIGDKRAVGIAMGNIGLVYFKKKDYKKALDYYKKYLKTAEEVMYQKGISIALNNLGNLYIQKSEMKKALEYFLRKLEIDEKSEDTLSIKATLKNISEIYHHLGDRKNHQKFHNRYLSKEAKALPSDNQRSG